MSTKEDVMYNRLLIRYVKLT